MLTHIAVDYELLQSTRVLRISQLEKLYGICSVLKVFELRPYHLQCGEVHHLLIDFLHVKILTIRDVLASFPKHFTVQISKYDLNISS